MTSTKPWHSQVLKAVSCKRGLPDSMWRLGHGCNKPKLHTLIFPPPPHQVGRYLKSYVQGLNLQA